MLEKVKRKKLRTKEQLLLCSVLLIVLFFSLKNKITSLSPSSLGRYLFQTECFLTIVRSRGTD